MKIKTSAEGAFHGYVHSFGLPIFSRSGHLLQESK